MTGWRRRGSGQLGAAPGIYNADTQRCDRSRNVGLVGYQVIVEMANEARDFERDLVVDFSPDARRLFVPRLLLQGARLPQRVQDRDYRDRGHRQQDDHRAGVRGLDRRLSPRARGPRRSTRRGPSSGWSGSKTAVSRYGTARHAAEMKRWSVARRRKWVDESLKFRTAMPVPAFDTIYFPVGVAGGSTQAPIGP